MVNETRRKTVKLVDTVSLGLVVFTGYNQRRVSAFLALVPLVACIISPDPGLRTPSGGADGAGADVNTKFVIAILTSSKGHVSQ